MGNSILQIDHLVKKFRSHWTFRQIEAVKEVSLEVFRGESFGFLGHNGAGKTTTLKCVMGLLQKTSGKVYFEGELLDSPEAHQSMGFLPELPYFYEHLSVSETLDFFASLCGLRGQEKQRRIEEVLGQVGLGSRKQSMVRSLSKGLQQRLGFAQAIISRPALLLLDEPFSGLDPIGRREMRELILDLKAGGTTIVLSSHILSDVEEICERVSIMKDGTLRSVFYLKDIPSLFGERYELKVVESDHPAIEEAAALSVEASVLRTADKSGRVLQFAGAESANRALHILSGANQNILSYESVGPRLEDIFVSITQGNGKTPAPVSTGLSDKPSPVSLMTGDAR